MILLFTIALSVWKFSIFSHYQFLSLECNIYLFILCSSVVTTIMHRLLKVGLSVFGNQFSSGLDVTRFNFPSALPVSCSWIIHFIYTYLILTAVRVHRVTSSTSKEHIYDPAMSSGKSRWPPFYWYLQYSTSASESTFTGLRDLRIKGNQRQW